MNRHARRSSLSCYRRETSGALLTYLVPPDDPALAKAPLLRAAASNWIDALPTRIRNCLVCASWLVDRRHVGAVLLAVPDTAKPTSASTCAICMACWDADLPVSALEQACAVVLRQVVPDGQFEPLDTGR